MARKDVVRFEHIDGKDLMYKNFEGRERRYKKEGDRNFCLRLTEEEYHHLLDLGYTSPKEKTRVGEDGEEYTNRYIPIKVNFNSKYPPVVHQVTRNGLVRLDEESIKILDWSDIIEASVAFSPYYREQSKTQTAWLQELLVEIDDDSFATRYLNDHND